MSNRNIRRAGSRQRTVFSEGRIGRLQRLRRVTRKIEVPRVPIAPPAVSAPVVTHADEATFERTHAANNAIAARNEQEAAAIKIELAAAQGDLAAGKDELRELNSRRAEACGRQREFDRKVEEAGLGHELVASSPWPVRLIQLVAIVFETVALAVPMQLLGAADLGGATTAALLLGFGYAVLLACLGEGVGHRLKYRGRWHLLEAEDINAAEAEGRPRPASLVLEDRVVASALAATGFALLAASVIREAAIKILAAAGESQVAVSWPIFLLLTLALFVAVVAISYWKAAPIAERHSRLKASVEAFDTPINATRRECFHGAALVDGYRTRLRAIEACNEEEQLTQLHLAAEEIAFRRAANPHIYGVATEPARVQNVIVSPKNYVRRLRVPAIPDELTQRIEEIRRDVTSPAAN